MKTIAFLEEVASFEDFSLWVGGKGLKALTTRHKMLDILDTQTYAP